MIIREIEIEDYRCFKKFHRTFGLRNCLIGLNGAGKTTLLSLIAGISGTDDATRLIAGRQVKFCRLIIDDGSETFCFEAREFFCEKKINDFKKNLLHRVNYAVSEDGVKGNLHSNRIDILKGLENFKNFIGVDYEESIYFPTDSSVKSLHGSGFSRAMAVFMNDSVENVPSLFDNPIRSLHIHLQSKMINQLTDNIRQIFFAATHTVGLSAAVDQLEFHNIKEK